MTPVTATEAGLSVLERGLERYSEFRAKKLRKHEKAASGAGRPSDETLPVTIKLGLTYRKELGEKKMPGFAPRCKMTVTEEMVGCQSNKVQLEISRTTTT